MSFPAPPTMSSSSRTPPPPTAGRLALGLAPPRAAAAAERVRLEDMAPHEGAPGAAYARAVEALAASLTRHNAAVVELAAADAAVVRCALESARVFFRLAGGKQGRGGVYVYRAGRTAEDGELTPACMSDAFRCLGKAARAALCAIARHLRLRSDVFNHLLDDTPLHMNEISSSELLVAYSDGPFQNGQITTGSQRSSTNEVERSLLTLIASDYPGIEVCDPNGRWYLADGGSSPGDLLLLTGRALSHVTAGLRPSASYRISKENCSELLTAGRASLTFRLMPHTNAVLDCSPISAAGLCMPQIYQPISVSQFMDDLSTEEHAIPNHLEPCDNQTTITSEPSLRSVLSDPLSGAFLEDAMVVSCGHSFGGLMLKKVIEMARCTVCNGEIDPSSLFPNFALRAVATVVKMEDDRRLFHNAALRKRRKGVIEQMDALKRYGKNIGEMASDAENSTSLKGVQYPFVVGERVLIMGNRRTPEKFVGKEALITSQCLNGWYLVKTLDGGESIRLQYRSLRKHPNPHTDVRLQPLTFLQNKS